MAKLKWTDKVTKTARPDLDPTEKLTAPEINELRDSVDGLHDTGGDFDSNRPVTREGELEGINLGKATVAETLEALLYPSQPPLANLTLTLDGNTSGADRNLEFEVAGNTKNATANWTATRQASTAEIDTIVIDGTSEIFTQPAAGNSVNGDQPVEITTNDDVAFSLVVTTVDGKTAQDTINVRFRWKLYIGFADDNTPTDQEIQAFSQQFGTDASFSGNEAHPDGATQKYFVIVFPLSWEPQGGVTIKKDNVDITGDFDRAVRGFTNAAGGAADHVILTSVNTTAGDYNNIEIVG